MKRFGVELDRDAADAITVASLRDAREMVLMTIQRSAKKADQEHHHQDMRDSFRILEAVDVMLGYFGAE